MADISHVFIRMTLNTIRSSYYTGRDALAARIAEADREALLFATELEAGNVDEFFVDDVTGQTFSMAEYHYYQTKSAREMLNSHAQAFAIMIHHAWEKHVLFLNHGWEKYKFREAYGELSRDGWTIDVPRLEKLRMVANFVKHESTEILSHFGEMFNDTPIYQINQKYIFEDDALIVSDHDIEEFMDAVLNSANQRVEL